MKTSPGRLQYREAARRPCSNERSEARRARGRDRLRAYIGRAADTGYSLGDPGRIPPTVRSWSQPRGVIGRVCSLYRAWRPTRGQVEGSHKGSPTESGGR